MSKNQWDKMVGIFLAVAFGLAVALVITGN